MIYTPRCVVDMLVSPTGSHCANKQVCTKITLGSFEISIAMDSSHGAGDLTRADIRVFDKNHGGDVTQAFLKGDECMLYGNAETLLRVMTEINNETNKG